jgi:hypothetical protein
MLVVEIKVQSPWKKHRAESIVILKQPKSGAQHVLRMERIQEKGKNGSEQSYVKTLYTKRNGDRISQTEMVNRGKL